MTRLPAPTFKELFDERYVLLYPEGWAVALDEASGGYPYTAYTPREVKYWYREDAIKYMKMFPNEHFTLHRVSGVNISVSVPD